MACTVCRASAVTRVPVRSIWSSTVWAIGTSLVVTPTSVCAAITVDDGRAPTSAASRWDWFPAASVAPRRVFPSSRTGINTAGPP